MRRPRIGRLIQNAMALVVSGAGSAVIGLVFWGFATHLVSAATIGRTSAEIAAMTLLAQLSQLSFGSIFERFLPVAGDQDVYKRQKLCGDEYDSCAEWERYATT